MRRKSEPDGCGKNAVRTPLRFGTALLFVNRSANGRACQPPSDEAQKSPTGPKKNATIPGALAALFRGFVAIFATSSDRPCKNRGHSG
jgi:hypothetical protein